MTILKKHKIFTIINLKYSIHNPKNNMKKFKIKRKSKMRSFGTNQKKLNRKSNKKTVNNQKDNKKSVQLIQIKHQDLLFKIYNKRIHSITI